MNNTNQYPWPTGHLHRPQSVDHGYWTGRQASPYPQPVWKTPNPPAKSLVSSVYPYPTPGWSPGWLMTPSYPITPLAPAALYPFPTPRPAPEEDDLPPLVPDSYSEQDVDPWGFSGPVPPYGYTATPLPTPPALLGYHIPTPLPEANDPLQAARLRARNEDTMPLLHMSRRKLKGRPPHWRSGYRPNPSTRMKSYFAKPVCTSTIHTLHPLVSYKFPRRFPLLLDLRCSHTQTVFHNPERYCNTVDLYQLATSPPTHEMELYHPSLPWNIHIRASTPSGITIYDVLFQLCHQLQAPIVETDFNNDILSSDDRERFIDAYHLRNAGSATGLAGGVRKVDFLGSHVLFRGLVRTREGWVIKTSSFY
ncbi:hypothetical protein BDP27DRAFT_1257111 [Rhodocollybia butyracea]|uniref:DUF6699 domain-containing protein n=1 Tax=Rhodocollybia butyracea TaxID=206335 RepID=A0A9P5Q781_9AGAR|nr:hypothetical protein BDP27DRAFT_1257111 [Rhodocollybia butyracea]